MPAPCQEKLYSPVWPGAFQKQKKLNALLNILASQLKLSFEGKTTYVLLSRVNNITFSELKACYEQGYHSQKLREWKEQFFRS